MFLSFEAPFGDEAEPACGVALALQLFALAVLHHLALALAKLAQHLNVRSAWPLGLSKNTFFPEFLFHTSPNLAAKALQIIMKNTWA